MNKGGVGDNHTIATNELNFNRLSLKYQKPFKHGLLSASIDYQDKAFEISGVNTDKYNVGLSWTMEL